MKAYLLAMTYPLPSFTHSSCGSCHKITIINESKRGAGVGKEGGQQDWERDNRQ